MPGNAEEIDVQIIDRDRNFSNGLSAVGMDDAAGRADLLGELGDRLDGTTSFCGRMNVPKPNGPNGPALGSDRTGETTPQRGIGPPRCAGGVIGSTVAGSSTTEV